MQNQTIKKIKEALIRAGSKFNIDKIEAYKRAIETETNPNAKWVLETILENAKVAEGDRVPLCDDTGVPHVFIEIRENRTLTGKMLMDIQMGIREGLQALPGRPMAVKGADLERIGQSKGLSEDPGDVLTAPFIIKNVEEEDLFRAHILLLGGGPAIRGKTYRIFHKHSVSNVIDEVVEWAIEGVSKLGCTPCTLAIGVGRSQYEATALMMESQVYGNHLIQTDIEKEITNKVNEAMIGPLNLGGKNTVLATFLKVGPQRASGIRVVSIRPNCCIEPRIARVEL